VHARYCIVPVRRTGKAPVPETGVWIASRFSAAHSESRKARLATVSGGDIAVQSLWQFGSLHIGARGAVENRAVRFTRALVLVVEFVASDESLRLCRTTAVNLLGQVMIHEWFCCDPYVARA
jgi:hypothetical protein